MSESHRIYIPMIGRDYCVTLSEQQWLARRHGLTLEQVRSLVRLVDLSGCKTATKAQRVLESVLADSSNATASGRVS
ncbi:MAG TPA: hypothetical protein PLQ71_08995 [Nitrospira sp.]|nr:hypothetical protein [Nitrospira sp.]